MITQAGAYLVNGRELVNSERRTLRAAIERLAGAKRDLPVFIRADAAATHQAVVTAMDVAGQLGFVKLNIADRHAARSASPVSRASRRVDRPARGVGSQPCPRLSRAPPRPIGGCCAICARTGGSSRRRSCRPRSMRCSARSVPLLMSEWIERLEDVVPQRRERAWQIPLADRRCCFRFAAPWIS